MLKNQSAIPTTVVNGFLGSGKTTIITHLIDELTQKKEKVIYIKNEIGETDLDAQLMRGKNIIAKELLNGCICCTLIGPFLASIDEVIKTYSPDRIIIESAGSADPASLALMVENHPLLKRDCVLTIIDVVNFSGFEKINQVVLRQAEFTDLIIFNKVELVDEQRKIQVVGYVREINEKAPIIEAKQGKVAADLVFGLKNSEIKFINEPHNHSKDHEHDDEITAFSISGENHINKISLESLLRNLPKNIFRVKGYFVDDQGTWIANKVFQRTDFTPSANNDLSGYKFIFIGYKTENNKTQIVKEWEKL